MSAKQFGHRLKQTIVVFLVAVGAVCLVGHGCKRSEPGGSPVAGGPNVLLISLDTARADFFSCYGHERATTPRIDALASEGTLYRSAYATNFWTLPSHASLLTGLYPGQAGATSETNHLPEAVTTLAERLGKAGYRTGAVVCNAWLSKANGFGQGFGDFVEMWRRRNAPMPNSTVAEVEQAAVDRAVSWMARRAAERAPFFVFVNLNIAHLPYDPPSEWQARFLSPRWAVDRISRLRGVTGMWPHLAGAIQLSASDLRIMRELYEAEIALADDFAGQLVDALKADGILDETLVIVTSDHGENIGDHGMIDHLLSMYDSTIRVPLIIRYPDRFDAGVVIDDLVSLVDVAPTILDVCGVSDEASGRGDRPAGLCNQERAPRSFVLAENDRPMNGIDLLRKDFPSFDTSTIDHRMRMIRTRGHKLIWRVGAGVELFDVRLDPGELNDVADDRGSVREELLGELRRWSESTGRREPPARFDGLDAETLEQLRSLGYVE
ncbi:MAG: sulfatase [Phycisphaerales bacterium]|nr:MAG: sulfatase [Phycisphaerales bacterium]